MVVLHDWTFGALILPRRTRGGQ